jgi:hypothetical protein
LLGFSQILGCQQVLHRNVSFCIAGVTSFWTMNIAAASLACLFYCQHCSAAYLVGSHRDLMVKTACFVWYRQGVCLTDSAEIIQKVRMLSIALNWTADFACTALETGWTRSCLAVAVFFRLNGHFVKDEVVWSFKNKHTAHHHRILAVHFIYQ